MTSSLNAQRGMTLIELMVALLLGLLLTAAAVQLLVTGQITYNLQKSSAEVQDNGLFGMEVLNRSMRLANYNNRTALINDEIPWGGVVLSSDVDDDPAKGDLPRNLEAVTTNGTAKNYIPAALLSRGNGMTAGTGNQWTGASNVVLSSGTSVASDQLVVQYTAPEDMYDCEGNRALGPRTASITENGTTVSRRIPGDTVVERYFLRQDNVKNASEPNAPLALACDASRYHLNDQARVIANTVIMGNPSDGGTAIPYGDAGQVIMNRVDQFHVLLGVQPPQAGDNRMLFYTLDNYMKLTAPRPRVVALKVAVLARSSSNSRNKQVDNSQVFELLDQQVKVKPASNDYYVRQVYTSTVALRNAMGDRS